MLDPKFFEDIAKRLADSLPSNLKHAKADLEKNFHSILQSAFSKLDLVTREEFDTQVAVLKKTRTKLDKLEKIVAQLEAREAVTPSPRKSSTTKKPAAKDK